MCTANVVYVMYEKRSSTPVSYTHLDVYKRQPLWLRRERNCRLHFASRRTQLCLPINLKLVFRSILEEYVEERTIVSH